MEDLLGQILVCPRDHSRLDARDTSLVCHQGHRYPYVDGIPIMLLEEVEPTHGDCLKTLRQVAAGNGPAPDGKSDTTRPDPIDRYVQQMVAATCGLMYRPLIGKLSRYPIPDLPLPEGTGEFFLDLGCGWGRWCISAAGKGYTPVGIDPSLDAVRAARRVARQLGVSSQYVVADARYLPFADTSFDVIFSYSVLQHLSKDNVRLCLAEVARTLKIPGMSVIQMPNIWGMRNLYHQVRRGFRKPSSFEQPRYWSLRELTDTFSRYIGPTSLFTDGYFGLGVALGEAHLLPLRYRLVVCLSERLRKLSAKRRWMNHFADSLFVRSSLAPEPRV